MSDIFQNIKIMVENDQDEMIDIDQNDDHNEVVNSNNGINLKQENSNIDQNKEDETEFHVNLDKVPSTLKNTVLNEKIYLNESLKEDETVPEIDIDNVSPEDLKKLYESLDINESSFMNQNSDFSLSNSILIEENDQFRKEALHIFGVDELSTDDIFDYFKKYKPFAVEWINDSSCNVVWKNENHSSNAILHMSIPYEESKHNELAGKGERKPPQGIKWRLSARSAKGYHIYMRFVRKSDRKRKGAESRSKYYVKYGNPNYNNLRGFISGTKRREMKEKQLNDAYADLADDHEDSDGRKLVSYNMDNNINDLEEFGTGTSQKVNDTSKFIRERSRSPIRSKKMRLYSDEIEEKDLKNKRRQRFGFESDLEHVPQSNHSFKDRQRYGRYNHKNYDRNNHHHRSYMDNEEFRSGNRDIKSRLGGRGYDK